MKTTIQINHKICSLEKKLKAKDKIYENFGEQEIHQLKDYIGDIFDYPYEQREFIFTMEQDFSTWCRNYTKV